MSGMHNMIIAGLALGLGALLTGCGAGGAADPAPSRTSASPSADDHLETFRQRRSRSSVTTRSQKRSQRSSRRPFSGSATWLTGSGGVGERDEKFLPAALHHTGRYENNRVECDHGRLTAQAPADARGEDESHGERGDPRARPHSEPPPRPLPLAVEAAPLFRLATAFEELRPAI